MRTNARENKAIKQAREQYAIPSNDDIEIDDNPALSNVEGEGIWVAAWVWVSNEEIE